MDHSNKVVLNETSIDEEEDIVQDDNDDEDENEENTPKGSELEWYHIFWYDVCYLVGRELFPFYEPSIALLSLFQKMGLDIDRNPKDIIEDTNVFQFVDEVRCSTRSSSKRKEQNIQLSSNVTQG